MTSSPADVAPRHLPAIDILKGLCALWVLLIHAEALRGQPLMVYVFDRAAPLFVILMGLNGELWWRGRRNGSRLRTWYVNRFWRLFPPMWTAVAAWWVLALVLPHHAPLTRLRLAEHLMGYLSGIGTSWFISLAVMVALAFPLLHWLARRFGIALLVALGVIGTCATFSYRFELMQRLGMFGLMVFPPRLLAELTFGMALALFIHRLGWRTGLSAAGVLIAYFTLPLLLGQHSPWQLPGPIALGGSNATACAYRLADLPTCVLLLQMSGALARSSAIARPLTWLGRESYGIYLGQMITHNALTMTWGYPAAIARFGPTVYFLLLLAGALLWVAGYKRAERWLGARIERSRPAMLSRDRSAARSGAGTWT